MILLVGKTYFKNVLLHAAQRSGIAEGGIFIMSSLVLKLNRITKAEKHFIDAAKQVKPEPLLITKCR
jgi:tRNA U55 pseudouridine synthase TruB